MEPTAELKICGITREEDVALCCRLGVSYVGFNFHAGSKRYIAPNRARTLWTERPAGLTKTVAVAVLVDQDPTDVAALLTEFPEIGVLQCHGHEDEAKLATLRKVIGSRKLWRAVRVEDEGYVSGASLLGCDLVLFDAPRRGAELGGTGVCFPSRYLKALPPSLTSFGIAGGITVDNIEEVLVFRPRLVDVASGAESSPGIKDALKVEALWRAISNV